LFSFRFHKTEPEQLSDELLLKKIALGDKDCLAECYKRHSMALYRYFLRMFNGRQELAEDFTHELFIKLIEHAVNFDPAKNARAWIFTIAANMCRNEWRNSSKRKNIIKNLDTGPDVYEVSQNKADLVLLKNKIDDALNTLDEEDKEILLLRYQQELSIKEIAQITGLPEGTVKSRIFYLLKKMSLQLKAFSTFLKN
jgi:RNA polymerase sigma-70 factor (ECF subfamily)